MTAARSTRPSARRLRRPLDRTGSSRVVCKFVLNTLRAFPGGPSLTARPAWRTRRRRPACAAVYQTGTRAQSQDREGGRSEHSAVTCSARGRSDPVAEHRELVAIECPVRARRNGRFGSIVRIPPDCGDRLLTRLKRSSAGRVDEIRNRGRTGAAFLVSRNRANGAL